MLYIPFYNVYNNQRRQNCRPACTGVRQQMMISLPLGHITNMALSQFFKPYNSQTYPDCYPASTNFSLQLTMTLFSLGHLTSIYDFISNLNNFATTKSNQTWQVVNQHHLHQPTGDDKVFTMKSRKAQRFSTDQVSCYCRR